MELTEAVWEQRNLGVSCIEVLTNGKDTAEEVIRVLNERREQYQVVKVLHGRTDLLIALQQAGFRFIETLFETEIDMKNGYPVPPVCRNFVPDIGYHLASDEESARIIETVREGHIFSTDRIALDPAFSPALAGQRYANWMRDMMQNRSSYMIVSEYRGKDLGFNLVLDKGTYFDGILGGLLPENLGSGLGFANSYTSYWATYELGGRKMRSCVSSNNFTMMQIHLLFGMKIRNLRYCLVRHLPQNEG